MLVMMQLVQIGAQNKTENDIKNNIAKMRPLSNLLHSLMLNQTTQPKVKKPTRVRKIPSFVVICMRFQTTTTNKMPNR